MLIVLVYFHVGQDEMTSDEPADDASLEDTLRARGAIACLPRDYERVLAAVGHGERDGGEQRGEGEQGDERKRMRRPRVAMSRATALTSFT